MRLLNRRRFIFPAVALVVALVLLGRWAMRADERVREPPRAEVLASIDNPPANHEVAPDVAPSTDTSVSAFGTFRGRVVDAITREPVREFELRFHGAQETKVGEEAPGMRAFRTSDGRFEWEYLPPGSWNMTANARGYQRFELVDLVIPRGKATPEIVLPLRAGYALRGRVYDEASAVGIASASVGFRLADESRFDGNWRTRVRVKTVKDGSFVLDGIPAGPVILEVDADEHARREVEVVVRDDNSPLEIGLATGGMIAGRLTAADGVTPVQGAVGLFSIEGNFGGRHGTDESGEFSYQNLPAGRYELTGETSGGSATQEIVLAGNQRLERIVLALGAGRDIHGVVTGLRPDELQLVTISMNREENGGNTYSHIPADDRGAYVLRGVQPGRVHLVVNIPGRGQLYRTVEMPASSDITANFDFPRGARLSGRVTRGGKPLPDTLVTPHPRRPDTEPSIFVSGTATSPQGEYVIENLVAGEYVLLVGGIYTSRAVRVSGDTAFDIEVPDTQISGRVLEEGGSAPVVEADVNVWSLEPAVSRVRRNTRTDHFGQFALIGVEPGDFMLCAYKPGYEMFRKRISSEGKPLANMTIRLREDQGVEVRAREADSGKPLRRVGVVETLDGDRHGILLQLRLDERGLGHIPSALAGSTLLFSARKDGLEVITINRWDGQRLDLEFERDTTQAAR